MFGLSLPEILFLAVLALVVIGPKQLPEVARTLGRFLNELKRSTSTFQQELKGHVRVEPTKDPVPSFQAEGAPLPGGEPLQQELISEIDGGSVQEPKKTT